MKIIKGYKTELDLNHAQITACLKHAGAARYAYNWGLRRYQEEYAAGRKTPSAINLHKELNMLKQTDFPWMYEVSKCAPQEALRNLEKAFKNFFHKADLKKAGQWKGKLGYPKFKSKKKGIGSFRLTGAIHLSEKSVQLPRLGTLRLKEKKYIPTSGVKILSATVSDGRTIENPKALRNGLKKLRRLSRRHSRTLKGSANRKKAMRKLARQHACIANLRQDALHKATSSLVAKTKPESERPQSIVIEDLNVSGMLKNRKLSRAIADVGLYEFRRQLTYKVELAGSTIKAVSRWYPSSKTCSACGWVDEDQTLNDRTFICEACSVVLDRALNAALNLAASA